jgi:hypothetical protein
MTHASSSPSEVVEHLELGRFEIDETDQLMRKQPPTRNRG